MIPGPIVEGDLQHLPPPTLERLATLRNFGLENLKAGRRVIVAARKLYGDWQKDLSDYYLGLLKNQAQARELVSRLMKGQDVGVLSDAGAPGIADPGAELVQAAHLLAVPVRPLVGPSAIPLALMASGLDGQEFAFNGYLPVKGADRKKALKRLEHLSLTTGQTQLFMETPYRNDALFGSALEALRAETLFTVAANILSEQAAIRTLPVGSWQELPGYSIGKVPAVFGIGQVVGKPEALLLTD